MEEKRTTTEPKSTAAFFMALIAGLWMLAGDTVIYARSAETRT